MERLDDHEWRIYASVGYGKIGSGVVFESARQEADAYATALEEDTSEWIGSYDLELEPVNQSVDEKQLILRVADTDVRNDERLQFIYQTHDGLQTVRPFTELDRGVAQFGRTLLHYAATKNDLAQRITPETVADRIHPADEDAWWTTYDRFVDGDE